ncbi:MAG: Verru_Chthon cassette protein C [bacterium]
MKTKRSRLIVEVGAALGCKRSTATFPDGFTIIELLLAAAILSIIVILMINMVSQTSKTWKSTTAKIEQFREARDAFDSITRRLGQATLKTYLDYDNPAKPTAYMRQSELRFLSGPTATILGGLSLPSTNPTMSVFFQAPNGFTTNTGNALLQNALNTWGYFIEYASDANNRPSFLSPNPRNRYRLMELMEPTESLSIYNYTSANRAYTNIDWIGNSMMQSYASRPAHVLAENVIALILLPKLSPADINKWNALGSNYTTASLAPTYVYNSATNLNATVPIDPNLNSHNQLPPVVQVTLIAVDEQSVIRFPTAVQNITNTYAGLFTDATQFTNDLGTVTSALNNAKINYRVFTTDVMIKGAKWSGSQTN